MAGVGHWAFDVAYFIAGALSPWNRREHEQELLRHYLARLSEHGPTEPTDEEA